MTLCKRDFQLFIKRLRFNTGVKTIKYYACGEYGSDTWRPHYHAIMYDVTEDSIEKAWGLGHIRIGTVTGASIGYTTKYICKDKRVPLHANDDRIPEFSLMSKNLGKNYVTPQMKKWHIENLASYVVVEGGYQKPLPRYYRDFIFNDDHKLKINAINQQRKNEQFDAQVHQAGSLDAYYHNRIEVVKQIIENTKLRVKQNRNKI